MSISLNELTRFLQYYSITELTSKQMKELASITLEMNINDLQKALKQVGIERKTLQETDSPLPDKNTLKELENALSSIRQWADDTLVKVGSFAPERILFAPERILSKIQNIYEFVAFFSIQKENNDGTIDESRLKKEADNWRQGLDNHSTDDLIEFLEKLAIEHARNIAPFVFFREIEHVCLTNIFVKGQIEAKAKYDFYLVLKESGVISDLEFVRNSLPSSLWHYPMLYKSMIKRMTAIEANNQFLTTAQCIQIYNHYVFGTSVSDYIDL